MKTIITVEGNQEQIQHIKNVVEMLNRYTSQKVRVKEWQAEDHYNYAMGLIALGDRVA